MGKKKNGSQAPADLRRQAEERLRMAGCDIAAMPLKDVQQLVHELQVHQIELEMQNEQLRVSQVELELARRPHKVVTRWMPSDCDWANAFK